LEIFISQGSVATLLTRGGMFDNYFVANCQQTLPAKAF